MVQKNNRVTEFDVARATMQVAASRSDGIARFKRLKVEIPNYLKLSTADRKQSLTRPNEEMWEQQIRNIKSHSSTPGNAICEGYLVHIKRVGYEITDSGRRYLKRKGY